jgi:epoxyqueuosine reductase QueG
MPNKSLTNRVKSLAKEIGIDLVGIAPAIRFRQAPSTARPEAILPEARSVLALALRINRSIQKVHLQQSINHPFFRFGHTLLAYKIDKIANEVANFLEDQGYDACPIPADSDIPSPSPYPLISHRHVAVAAGLGHIGWSNNLITPEFGAGVKLGSIITSADLIPDPILPENCCTRCLACVNICPVEAIHPAEGKTFILDGMVFEHSRYLKDKCLSSCGYCLAICHPEEHPH